MILEYAQLLSGVHHLYGSVDDRLYKPTHMKHPSALWVQESRTNYQFVRDLLEQLLLEYDYRYGLRTNKYHKTGNMFEAVSSPPSKIPELGPTVLPQCMPDQYKDDHPCYAYRKFYIEEKSRFARWNYTDTPLWYYTGDVTQEGFKNILGN